MPRFLLHLALFTLALAAGYKAAFLCSGVFDAGETEAAATADDLEGVYPEYQTAIRTLKASIDPVAKTVSVPFDAHLPPRIAAWRPNLGCAQLPVGANPHDIALLPHMDLANRHSDQRPWPDGDVDALGTAIPALDPVVAGAFDHTATTAIVILHHGRIVAERYRDGYEPHRPQRTWSAAKSLTATVLGRAVQLGMLTLATPANIPEWRTPGDPRAAITWKQLMNMASGLYSAGPGNRTDEIYIGGASVTQVATSMPLEAAPGSRFNYANNDALLAARGLRAVIGNDRRALEFPFTELLWKIGMNHTTLETDWQGNFILSSQVWTTARDLARLGQFYLADGVWNGERLLPEGGSRLVSTPAPAQPASDRAGYGAFFWLYGPRQGLPAGTYAMEGNRGQYVFIAPTKDVVIVRRGFDAAGAPPFDAAGFAREVLARIN